MIRYTLKCDRDHGFESWFKSAEAYDTLRAAGHVACPECGSSSVQKAMMAPNVSPARRKEASSAPALSTPADSREEALAELRRQIETNSEYVGMNFAAEARKIHEGEAPGRSIYGEAKPDDARKLIEDGVPVARLPFLPKARTS